MRCCPIRWPNSFRDLKILPASMPRCWRGACVNESDSLWRWKVSDASSAVHNHWRQYHLTVKTVGSGVRTSFSDASLDHVILGKPLRFSRLSFGRDTGAWRSHSKRTAGVMRRTMGLQFPHVCHCLRRQSFPEMEGWLRRLEQYVHMNFERSEVRE